MKTATKTAAIPKSSTIFAPIPANGKLLSLDVSSTAIGFAVFRVNKVYPVAFGRIKHPEKWPDSRRIRANSRLLEEHMAGECVTHVVMEWQSPWRASRMPNATGLAILGKAQGYMLCVLDRIGLIPDANGDLPIDLVSEREWTQQNGWPARKDVRAAQVRLLCPDYAKEVRKNPKWDDGLDVADAIGLALWRLSITGG